jgi:chromosome segregation ATPase
MREEPTQPLPNDELRQILARLDSINARLTSLEEKVEARLYDARPIWERALQEIGETRLEMRAGFERVDEHFILLEDKIQALSDDILTMRAKHSRLSSRVRDLETASVQ